MLSLPPSVRIYLSVQATDMRKSFDGLAAIAESTLQLDPLSGHLFLFRNRRGDRIKILYWDRDGYAIWMKRLQKGTFRFPPADAVVAEVTATELTLLLDGIDLSSVRRRPRYRLPATPGAQ